MAKNERAITVKEIVPLAVILLSIPFVALYYYKFEFIWSKQASSNAFLLLAFLASIPLLMKRPVSRVFSTDFAIFLSLAFWAALSAAWAKVPLKVFKLGTMLFAAPMAYGVMRVILDGKRKIDKVKLFLIASLITGIIVSLYGILQFHIDRGFFEMPKDQYGAKDPVTAYGLSNFTVDVLVVILPMGLAFVKGSSKIDRIGRWLGIASSILITYYILISKVRAGYMAVITMSISLLIVSIIYKRSFFARHLRKILLTVLVAGALVSAFLTLTPPGRDIYHTFMSSFNREHSSVKIRIHAWERALHIIKDHFLIGVGLGNYEVFSWKYQDEVQEKMTLESNTRVDKTHNEYLNIFADLGIAGLILFLSAFIVLAVKTFKYLSAHREGNEYWIALCLALSVVGEFTDATFTFPFQMPGSIHQFFLTAGALSVLVDEWDPLRRFFQGKTSEALFEVFKYVGIVLVLAGGVISIWWNRNFTLSEIYYRIGQMLKKRGNLQASLLFFEKGLKYEPFAERIYYDRAFVLSRLGRPGEAAESMANCLKEVPYFGKARKEYALFLSEAGKIDEAIQELYKALPTHMYAAGEIHLYLASLYMKKSNPKKAIEEVLEAMRHGMRNANALTVLGNALFAVGRAGLGGSVLRQAILVSGNNYESVASYVLFLTRVGKKKEALRILEESEEDLGDDPRYWYVRATVEADMGLKARAKRSVEKAMVSPDMRRRIKSNPLLVNLMPRGE